MHDTQLRELHAQGHSELAIAELLNIPKATVARRMKKLALSLPSEQHLDVVRPPSTTSRCTQSIPYVHQCIPDEMTHDLQEIVAAWHDKKAALQQAQDASRKTERTTFHVEQRWIEAIKRQADLEGMTYTYIVNDAFRQYFAGK